jgi:hypothetical protein
MLQHNSQVAGKRAHIAHAAVVSLHAICCGGPALAMLAAAASGAASATYLSINITEIHDFLHAHEVLVVVLSATLVVLGGALEALARRRRALGFPWLFGFSVFCFLGNIALMLIHRGALNVWA